MSFETNNNKSAKSTLKHVQSLRTDWNFTKFNANCIYQSYNTVHLFNKLSISFTECSILCIEFKFLFFYYGSMAIKGSCISSKLLIANGFDKPSSIVLVLFFSFIFLFLSLRNNCLRVSLAFSTNVLKYVTIKTMTINIINQNTQTLTI